MSGSWQGDISKVVNGDSNESKYQLMFTKVQLAAVVVGRDVDDGSKVGVGINYVSTP